MEKRKEALSASDEGELGDNSAKGDNHVEPIPESSSHSAAFPEESLEGMEQQIDSNTLTNRESVETAEHILIHVEAPNDLHTGGSDRSGPENSNCSQMKNQIRKLTNQVKTLQTKLNDHRKNRKITKRRLGKSYYYFINYSKSSPIYIIFCAFA